MKEFTEKFCDYVCLGDTISTERDGFTITARIEYDQDYTIDADDVHSEDQSVTGCTDEQHAANMAAREAWYNSEWFYGGLVLAVSRAGITLDEYAASLWGLEINYPGSDNSYLTDTANELLDEAIERGAEILDTLQIKQQEITP